MHVVRYYQVWKEVVGEAQLVEQFADSSDEGEDSYTGAPPHALPLHGVELSRSHVRDMSETCPRHVRRLQRAARPRHVCAVGL